MSIFNNESILAWLKYFSDHSEIDLSTVRILDITGENRNLLPTVQANRSVLVFTDGTTRRFFTACGTRAWGTVRFGTTRAPSPRAL